MTRILDMRFSPTHPEMRPSEVQLRFLPQIPDHETDSAFVLFGDGDPTAVGKGLIEQGAIADFELLGRHSRETMARFEWTADPLPFNECVREARGGIEQLRYGQGRWTARVRFPSADSLREFHEHCRRKDISFEVNRVIDSAPPDTGAGNRLTTKQREALALAERRGYFSIPREASTQILAAELGISDQAFIERIRRGIGRLVRETIS